jgi:hypothetical protein
MIAKFLPIAQQIGTYLKMGMDHYADLRAAGKDASPEIVAFFLREKMQTWDPKVSGKSLLDDATRDAGARFLAGVAINFAGAP